MAELKAVQEARTWALNDLASEAGEAGEAGSFLQGSCDGLEALRQAVFLLLQTERGRWPVFSAGFGVDLLGLVGQPAAYVIPEAERRLREALLQDDRVLAVEEFRFARQGRKLTVSFLVRSVYGDLQAEVEI